MGEESCDAVLGNVGDFGVIPPHGEAIFAVERLTGDECTLDSNLKML